MRDMTLIVDEKRIPIKVDLSALKVSMIHETVLLGGETDEEFASRRNSFGRWLWGLPKKRKEGTLVPVPRLRHHEPLKIITNEIKFFKSWPLDLFPIKNDCIICSLNEKDYVKLVGCFPVGFNGGDFALMYDLWEEHGDIFNEEEVNAS